MAKKPVITSVQLMFLATGSSFMFPYTFLPALRTPPANQDSWLVTILMFVYVLVLNAPLLFLMNRLRGLNINEMVETILGKFFGKAVAVIFAGFCMFCYAACLSMGVIFLNIFVFPETPSWALALYMIVPVIYASCKGAGIIGRLATFIASFMILTIVFFFLLGTNKMDFSILQPVLADSTFMELNLGAFLTAARYSEIIIFLVFSYFLGQKASINKTYVASLATFGVCVLLIMIPVLTVLGPDLAKHAWNPYFTYTSQLEAYDFIQRLQSISTLAWLTGMLLKLSIYNFMASYILSGVVKAKSHRGFVIPLAVIAFIICLLPFMNKSSTIELLRSDQVFPWIILPVIFVLPLIIVIVYFFRRKKIRLILGQKLTSGLSSGTK